jgi:hypothetical protein
MDVPVPLYSSFADVNTFTTITPLRLRPDPDTL